MFTEIVQGKGKQNISSNFAEVFRLFYRRTEYKCFYVTPRDIHIEQNIIIDVLSVIHIHMMRMVADGLEIGEQGIKLMIK